jgi:hypothetical protein
MLIAYSFQAIQYNFLLPLQFFFYYLDNLKIFQCVQ